MAIKRINQELKALIGDELYSQIEAKIKDKDVVIETTEGYIPKERFDKVNDDLKEYKTKFEGTNAEYEKLKPLAAGNEALTKQLQELQAVNEKTKTEYEAKIQARERDYALTESLRGAKAKNSKAVMALLDNEKIKLNGGKLEGIDEQIEALKKSDPYLFDVAVQPKVDAFGRPIVTNQPPVPGGKETVTQEAIDLAAKYVSKSAVEKVK